MGWIRRAEQRQKAQKRKKKQLNKLSAHTMSEIDHWFKKTASSHGGKCRTRKGRKKSSGLKPQQ